VLADTAPHAFTVGRFLEKTFSTWGRNTPWLIPLSLVIHAPMAFAMYHLYSGLGAAGARGAGAGAELQQFQRFLIPALVTFGLYLVLTPLELVAISRAGVRRMRGEPFGWGELVGEAARCYFPAAAVLLLTSLAGTATVCTVVVPFILYTAWAVAIPALTFERRGPIEAMKRSWELTRGLRWQVFAGFLVVGLAMWSCACAVQSVMSVVVIGFAAAAGGAGGDPQRLMSSMGGLQAVNMLVQGVLYSALFTGSAVAYHQLRVATEGPGTSQLERVFE
jgi:hypothetical protein